MKKSVRARGIIIKNGELVVMYREFEGRKFYTFPGGGMEDGESETECVKREVLEEMGLIVEPIKKVYTYIDDKSIQHFYICECTEVKLAKPEGEEYLQNRNRGLYLPSLIEIFKIPNLPLMPNEIANEFYNDYLLFGPMLNRKVKKICSKNKR